MKTRTVASDLLHDYQRKCVDKLAEFVGRTRTMSVKAAFADCVPASWDAPYRAISDMIPDSKMNPDAPYVCVKVPTGGGKTLIAAAAVGPVARLLRKEPPTVLWLAPTTAIVDQTLRALQENPRLSGELTRSIPDFETAAISLSEAYGLSPDDLNSKAVVIVATVQSLKDRDGKGRKINEDAGQLMAHFEGMPESVRASLPQEDGRPAYSLANVIRARNPLVIVDEAHGVRSDLSFETLAGLDPSCILEFTATPKTRAAGAAAPSNVLHQVSAYDLKRNHMIKSPILVAGSDDWRETVRMAVAKRAELDKAAQKEGADFVPIVLFQAEAANRQVTAKVLCDALIKDFGDIGEEQVILAIGGKALSDGIGTRKNPVRFVVTVQQLAEGWDCPAAYILCSVSNISAAVAAEQILGRVLRLPDARKQSPALSGAHVFAARPQFTGAARAIVDALEKSHGFARDDAEKMIGQPAKRGSANENAVAPAARKNPFRIPRMAIESNGRLELFKASHLALSGPLTASDLRPDLPNFSPEAAVSSELVDVRKDGNLVRMPVRDFSRQLEERSALFNSDRDWTLERLTTWIARQVNRPDVPYALTLDFVRAALAGAQKKHGLDEAGLIARRYALETEIAGRLDEHRRERRKRGFNSALTGKLGGMNLTTSTAAALEITAQNYQPRELHDGAITFSRHIFPNKIGKLDTNEERECAAHIDALPETEVWLRNLAGDDLHSFWLPTSSDLFYPDFVVRLKDGRILVVEYKGEQDWTTDDSKEKRDIGELWANKSGGGCLFVMVNENLDGGFRAINNAVAQKPPAQKRK